MKYIVSATTDVGNVKTTNQDSLCIKVAETKKYGQVMLAMVCDGMGGLSKGELASSTVVKAFSDWFEQGLPVLIKNFSWEMVQKHWENLIRKVNRDLLDYGKRENISLGTTLTAMLFVGNEYLIVHVGDTRVYEIKEQIRQITEDQTFIQREIKSGNMTVEEAKIDPRRNVLLQCVGATENVKPTILKGTVHSDSEYMICSDGFRHMISEAEMYERLNPHALMEKYQMDINGKSLVELVKNRNERDNITVLLMKAND